uniref:DNA transfer protein n=1 Tax=viral metagenome TaxID=1070528 RepID=A0A6M3K2S6_9ZZZZ
MAISLGLGLLLGGLASGASSLLGARGASDAAGIQADAAARAQEKAIEAQLQMYYQSRADLQPWTEAGRIALGQLFGTGLTQTYPTAQNALVGGQQGENSIIPMSEVQPGRFVPFQATLTPHEQDVIRAVEQIGGYEADANMVEYNKIKQREANHVPNALAAMTQSPQARVDAAPMLSPGDDGYQNGLIADYQTAIKELTPEGYEKSPYYDFLLGEGIGAIERGAAGRGKLLGGQTQKSLMEYGQNFAKTDYQNWLNQGYRAAGAPLDPYMQTLGYGSGAASQTAGNALAAGQNQANTYLQTIPAQGQARAAGVLGQANTWGNLANWGGNQLANYALLNQNNQPVAGNALAGGYYNMPSGGAGNEWWRYM